MDSIGRTTVTEAGRRSVPRRGRALPWVTLATLLCASGITACSSEDGLDTSELDSVDQPIIGGTYRPDNYNHAVIIQMRNGGSWGYHCTGHLLNNKWVLTANHCYLYGTSASNIRIKFRENGSSTWQTRNVAELVRDPSNDSFTPADNNQIGGQAVDLALLHLTQAVTLNGHTYGIHNAVVPNDNTVYAGLQVRCEAYGPTSAGGNDFGNLREAWPAVATVELNGTHVYNGTTYDHGTLYWTSLFAAGGDSGGNCFHDTTAGRVLVANISSGTLITSTGRGAQRSWIDRTQFSTYSPVGDLTTDYAPAMIAVTPGNVQLFATSDADTQIYRSIGSAGSYGSWTRVSNGLFQSGPSAGYVGNRVMVVGLGLDDQYWYATARWSTFGGFSAIPNGTFASAPAVAASPNASQLVVFGRGGDDRIWYRKYSGGAWQGSGWTPIGSGLFNSAPAAVFTSNSKVFVVARGLDNKYYASQGTLGTTDTFTNWSNYEGGVYDSGPAVASWGGNRLDVFGIGTDEALYHNGTDGVAWFGAKLDHGLFEHGAAAVGDAVGSIHLAAVGLDDRVWVGRYPE